MNPLVSIIIPCYKQAQYLEETLQSVLQQTYSNWECILVDDGSPDNTKEIATQWTTNDKRFCYFYKENEGVSKARNFGIEKANGTYIQFLDADDLIDERKLELSINELNRIKEEHAKIVISNFRMFTENLSKSTIPYCELRADLFTFENILYKWNEGFSIPIHCGFFHHSLFKDVRFPENMTAQEDWIVWVNLFKIGTKAMFLDISLAFYRLNPNSRMMTNDIFLDQLKAYEYFKTILTEAEYNKFSLVLISRYFKSNIYLKKRMVQLKQTNTYILGNSIKKIVKKMGLLKPSKYVFEKILKLDVVAKHL
jgi:hypothetical protein